MENLWKRYRQPIRVVAGAVSLLLAILGIAGVPDNIRVWGEWMNKAANFMSHEIVRTVIATVGMATLVWLLLSEYHRVRGSMHRLSRDQGGEIAEARVPGRNAPETRIHTTQITPLDRINEVRGWIAQQAVAIEAKASRDEAISWRDVTAEMLSDNCQASVPMVFKQITADILQSGRLLKKTILSGKQHLSELSRSLPPEQISLKVTKERLAIDREPRHTVGGDWHIYARNVTDGVVVVSAALVDTSPRLPDEISLPIPLRFALTPADEALVLSKNEAAMISVCLFRPTEKTNAICAPGGYQSFVTVPKENYELTVRVWAVNGGTDSVKLKMVNSQSHGHLVVAS